MKKVLFYLTAMAGLCACSSALEEPVLADLSQGDEATLTVSVDEATKVDINDNDASSSLSWNNSDKLALISQDGSQTEVYSIKQYGASSCVFSGNAMTSTTVSILLPGNKYTKISDLEQKTYSDQEQNGNASLAHLEYNAWLKNVSDYANVTFSQAWASAHGGTCFQNGCIKVRLTLPTSMTGHQVSALSLKTDRATFRPSLYGSKTSSFGLSLKNVTIGQDRNLTAYMMFPAEDISFASGQNLTVVLLVDKKYYMEKTVDMSNKTLLTGKMNVLTLNADNWVLKDMMTNQVITPSITMDGIAGTDEWTIPHPGIVALTLPENAYYTDLYNAYVYADSGWVFLKMEFFMPYWNYSLPFNVMFDIDGNPATGATVTSHTYENGDEKMYWSPMGIEWYFESPGLSNGVDNFYDWTCDAVTGKNQMQWWKYTGTNGGDIFSGGLNRMYYTTEVPNQLTDRYVKAIGILDQVHEKAVLEVRIRRFSLEARNTAASKMRIGFKYMSTPRSTSVSGWGFYGLLPQGSKTGGVRQLVPMADVYLPPYQDYEWPF